MENITQDLLREKRELLFNEGYVHIKGALQHEAVDGARKEIDTFFDRFSEISENYKKIHTPSETSSKSFDTEKILEINKLAILLPALKKSFVTKQCQWIANNLANRRTFYSFDHAIYKPPGSGETSWHQDQAYKARVKNMQSLHFWIPLHDIAGNEGGMQYVTGSHRSGIIEHTKNSRTHTLSVDSAHIEKSKVITHSVEQGDVIIHLPKTLHGSTTNLGEKTRKAWIIHFSPYGRYEPILPTNLAYYLGKKLHPQRM